MSMRGRFGIKSSFQDQNIYPRLPSTAPAAPLNTTSFVINVKSDGRFLASVTYTAALLVVLFALLL